MARFVAVALFLIGALLSTPGMTTPMATQFVWDSGKPIIMVACKKKKCANCRRKMGDNPSWCLDACSGC
jgi:hypothetical protein